jgi:hypothetical protein
VLLELEVKGLHGRDLQIGVTPNEYRVLKEHEDGNHPQYRLCVVTNALSVHPKLHVFTHDNGSWYDEIGGRRAALTITPLTAAIVRLGSRRDLRTGTLKDG